MYKILIPPVLKLRRSSDVFYTNRNDCIIIYTRNLKLTSNIKNKKYPEVFERTCEIEIVGIIYRVYTYISFDVTKLPNSPSARE